MPAVIAPNQQFKQLASQAQIERTAASLDPHGIHVLVTAHPIWTLYLTDQQVGLLVLTHAPESMLIYSIA